MPRVAADLQVRVSVGTLRRLARRAGYSWKRTRRSLKARRDAVLFGFFQQEVQALHALEAAGALRVVYVDECRFSRLPAHLPGIGHRRRSRCRPSAAAGATPCWACGRPRPRASR